MPATWKTKEDLEEKYAGETQKSKLARGASSEQEISGVLLSIVSPHENQFKRC